MGDPSHHHLLLYLIYQESSNEGPREPSVTLKLILVESGKYMSLKGTDLFAR